VKLLQRALAVLRSDPAEALILADRDGARFPGGALEQEREVIAIEALFGVQRVAEGHTRALRFLQSFPASAHGPRIRALLDSP
jgi:hypothetical protein